MPNQYRPARINVKALIIGLVLIVALGGSLLAVRQARGSALSKKYLAAGQAAYEAENWPTAYRHFQEFLHLSPDNSEILKKLAQARLRMRPFEPVAIYQAAAAYRRVIQLAPHDEIAYNELARLNRAVRNFDELARIARQRIEHCPDDKKAPFWVAEALIFQEKTQAAREVLEPYIAEVEALPDKHDEYVDAYLLMSRVAQSEEATGAKRRALGWLSSAVDYAPTSVEALVQRAQFYIGNPGLSGTDKTQALDGARQDLEAADGLGTDNPDLRFSLGAIWMALGELDRAEAELRAVETLDETSLEEHYLDLKDGLISKYFFASELALRRGAPTEAASQADEALSQLERPGHRMRILPSTINVYVAAGRISNARQRLDEYTEALHAHHGADSLRTTLDYLHALVAQAEETPQAKIDVLQPDMGNDTAWPEQRHLPDPAHKHPGRTKRVASAASVYHRVYPQDWGLPRHGPNLAQAAQVNPSLHTCATGGDAHSHVQ